MKEHKRIGTFFGGFVTALALSACLTTAANRQKVPGPSDSMCLRNVGRLV